MAIHLTGHCLCNRCRYTVTDPASLTVVHCHCTMCRHASGAVAVTWFTVPIEAFRSTGEPLTLFKSSDHGERGFCNRCGAPITFVTSRDPGMIDVTVATLDTPEALSPEAHVHPDSRIPWLTLDPHLPDHRSDG